MHPLHNCHHIKLYRPSVKQFITTHRNEGGRVPLREGPSLPPSDVPDGRIHQREEMRWFGHVQRRDKYDATRKILQMTVDGKRIRGRPKLRWRDLVKEDMARNQMTTEMAEDRKHWHVMIRAGTLRSVVADR